MTTTPTSQQAAACVTDVSSWIIAHLEKRFPAMAGVIHADMSFDAIGLDSLERVDLIAALEGRFGITLDPTLGYDFVTTGALAAFVWGQISGVAVDEKQLMGV